MPAAFQDIEEADEIGVRIGMRVDQRMPHPGLRREMDHQREAMRGEQSCGSSAIRQIQPHEFEILGACQLPQPRFLQRRIVIRREVVDADHVAAGLHQMTRDMKSDEAGRAGDENGIYSRHRSMPSGFGPRLRLDVMPGTVSLPPINNRPSFKTQPGGGVFHTIK